MTPKCIILASQSKARKEMLQAAGLNFKAFAADLDEKSIISSMNEDKNAAASIAKELAQQKAIKISSNHKDELVVGSDQLLVFEDKIISKAENAGEAIVRLKNMAGKKHKLISAVSVVKNENVIWSHVDEATLHMHEQTDEFWQTYKNAADYALTSSVGGYWIEAHGAWLFEKTEGDYFTVLGMPLRPLLRYLQTEHNWELSA